MLDFTVNNHNLFCKDALYIIIYATLLVYSNILSRIQCSWLYNLRTELRRLYEFYSVNMLNCFDY